MLTIAIAFAIATLYALVCLGWGDILRRAVGFARGGAVIDMAFGLAALTIVGGILNLLRIAVPTAIGLVAVIGCGVAAYRIWDRLSVVTSEGLREGIRAYGMSAAIVVAAMIFVASTQVPPSAMNVGDDVQKYLAHLTRMLQTGTLFGSPLNALGTESPGGQPFLQSFIAMLAPFPYVNGFDALFCFGLCMALAAKLTGRGRGLAFIAALAAAAVALIEQQYVNISALYAGSALMLALYALLAMPDEIDASPPGRRALAAGLVAGAMIALKPTLLIMAAIMLGAGVASVAASTRRVTAMVKWSAAAVAGIIVALLPWILLYAPFLGDISSASSSGSVVAQSAIPPIGLFSTTPLTWGASGLAYTLAVLFPLVASALAFLRWRSLNAAEQQGAVVLGASALLTVGAYFFVVLLLGRYFADYDTALRYVIPAIIAAVPASIALGGRFFLRGDSRPLAIPAGGYAVIAASALALFVPALSQRMAQARDFHHVLAFRYSSITEDYRALYAELTSTERAQLVAGLQQMAPPGAPILAIMSAAFRLDFGRNPIYDVTVAGLHAPWAHIPPVEYVIWDYGAETSPVRNLLPREPGQGDPRVFGLVKMLGDAPKTGAPGAPVYNDGRFAVFRVPGLPRTWPDYP